MESYCTCIRIAAREITAQDGTYQLDGVASPLERVYGGRMLYVDDGHVVHLQYRVVDTQTSVRGRGTARYELGDVNGGVVAVVRIVRAAGNAETEARTSPFQNYLLILPVIVAVHLEAQKCRDPTVILTVSTSAPPSGLGSIFYFFTLYIVIYKNKRTYIYLFTLPLKNLEPHNFYIKLYFSHKYDYFTWLCCESAPKF